MKGNQQRGYVSPLADQRPEAQPHSGSSATVSRYMQPSLLEQHCNILFWKFPGYFHAVQLMSLYYCIHCHACSTVSGITIMNSLIQPFVTLWFPQRTKVRIQLTDCEVLYQVLHSYGTPQWAWGSYEEHILPQQILLHNPSEMLNNRLGQGIHHCKSHQTSEN